MRQDETPYWARTMQDHGEVEDTGVIRTPEVVPWLNPGPPPNARSDQRPSGLVIYIGAGVVLAMVALVIGLVVAFTSEDSGVAACRAIAEGKAADGGQSKVAGDMTEQEYQRGRKLFADSSDKDIRAHGTTLFDLAWQLQQSPDSALLLLGDMTRAYTGLAGACASHGYTIPALGTQ